MGAGADARLAERAGQTDPKPEFPRYMVRKGRGNEWILLPRDEARQYVARHPDACLTSLVLFEDWTLGTAQDEPGMEPVEFAFPRGAD